MSQPDSCAQMRDRNAANEAQMNSDDLVSNKRSSDHSVEASAKLLAEVARDYGRSVKAVMSSKEAMDEHEKTDEALVKLVKSIDSSKIDDVLSRANYRLAGDTEKFSHASGEVWVGLRKDSEKEFSLARGFITVPNTGNCFGYGAHHGYMQTVPHMTHELRITPITPPQSIQRPLIAPVTRPSAPSPMMQGPYGY